ncbi:MAG: DUF4340 domain-containing protein, partial [Anaerolineae bacterium]|nr:DUF4340 domain-containing protein [Anaerolineae bacterium]
MSTEQKRLRWLNGLDTWLSRLGLKRHNRILAGILILQIAVAVVVFWPRAAQGPASAPVFPGLDADQIVGLTISESDGKQLALRKVAGDWVLPEADDYPANGTKIDPVIEKLVGLETGRLVARTMDSQRRLQVAPDDYVRRLELETADGQRWTVFLGSSPSYGATHFRLDGQSDIYLTDGVSTWELAATPSTWIDASYVDVPLADVRRFVLQNANGALVLTQDAEGAWSLEGLAEGDTLDQSKASTLVRRAASLRMDRPLGKGDAAAYGLTEPSAEAMLETADRTVVLRVGAQDPSDKS